LDRRFANTRRGCTETNVGNHGIVTERGHHGGDIATIEGVNVLLDENSEIDGGMRVASRRKRRDSH
jgi:hypothetical protein